MNFMSIETSLRARRFLQKTVLVMRLTLLLLMVVCFRQSAKCLGQRINISGKVMPLEKGSTKIRKQTGSVFFYDYAILDPKEKLCLFLFVLINSLADPNPQVIRSLGAHSQIFVRLSVRIPMGKLLIILTRMEIIAHKISDLLSVVQVLSIAAGHLFPDHPIIGEMENAFLIAKVGIWLLIKLILFLKGI